MTAFTDKQRSIFKFFNGKKDVYVDPLKVHARLLTEYPKESNLDSDWKLLQIVNDLKPSNSESDSKIAADASQAMLRLGEWANKVFDLQPLNEDGEGVTVNEAMEIMTSFLQWVDGVKKNIEPTQTLPMSIRQSRNPRHTKSIAD